MDFTQIWHKLPPTCDSNHPIIQLWILRFCLCLIITEVVQRQQSKVCPTSFKFVSLYKSAMDCSIYIKYGTKFDDMTNVQGHGVKCQGRSITYCIRGDTYKSGMDKLTEFSGNFHTVQRYMWHMFNVISSNTKIATTPVNIAQFC